MKTFDCSVEFAQLWENDPNMTSHHDNAPESVLCIIRQVRQLKTFTNGCLVKQF